jgi:hypothetical protein
MSEKTDIVERLRNRDGLLIDEPDGGYSIHFALLDEAINRIEYLEFELRCVKDERDAALADVAHLTQERDAARAGEACANDIAKMLRNEVRW